MCEAKKVISPQTRRVTLPQLLPVQTATVTVTKATITIRTTTVTTTTVAVAVAVNQNKQIAKCCQVWVESFSCRLEGRLLMTIKKMPFSWKTSDKVLRKTHTHIHTHIADPVIGCIYSHKEKRRFKGNFKRKLSKCRGKEAARGGGWRERVSYYNVWTRIYQMLLNGKPIQVRRQNPFAVCQHIIRFAYINKVYQKHIHSARTFAKWRGATQEGEEGGATKRFSTWHVLKWLPLGVAFATVVVARVAARRILNLFFPFKQFSKLVYNSIL